MSVCVTQDQELCHWGCMLKHHTNPNRAHDPRFPHPPSCFCSCSSLPSPQDQRMASRHVCVVLTKADAPATATAPEMDTALGLAELAVSPRGWGSYGI